MKTILILFKICVSIMIQNVNKPRVLLTLRDQLSPLLLTSLLASYFLYLAMLNFRALDTTSLVPVNISELQTIYNSLQSSKLFEAFVYLALFTYCMVFTYYLKSQYLYKEKFSLYNKPLPLWFSILIVLLFILFLLPQILISWNLIDDLWDKSMKPYIISLFSILSYSYLFFTLLIAIWLVYIIYTQCQRFYTSLTTVKIKTKRKIKKLKVKKVNRQNLLPVEDCVPSGAWEEEYYKGLNNTKEGVLNLNSYVIYIYTLLAICLYFFTENLEIFDNPIYCDTGDGNTSKDQTATTAENTPSVSTVTTSTTGPEGAPSVSTVTTTTDITNSPAPQSLNNQLGKDAVFLAREVGKVLAENTSQTIEKIGENVTSTIGKGISQAVGQAGLTGAIIGGMTVGASISSGQRPAARIVTSATLGVTAGAAQVVLSAANRTLAEVQGSRSRGSNSRPPSPGLEPSDYPVRSVNESFDFELLTDNPVHDWLLGMVTISICNLILTLLLLSTFISKLLLSINYEFKWFNLILPVSISEKIRFVILKIFKILSGIRTFNIIMLLLFLIITNGILAYYLALFFTNFEAVAELYLKLMKRG